MFNLVIRIGSAAWRKCITITVNNEHSVN